MSQKQKNALISVSDKAGIVEFTRKLVTLGFNIYASGGTAKKLLSADIPVTDVAELVGGEAILGHRVVTLSREVHAGLLARPDVKADMDELEELGIPFLNLVYCNMYPLVEEIAKSEATFESVIDQTDIGGPTMIRSAAKGRRIVICDRMDQDQVIEYIKNGDQHQDFLQRLIAKAEYIVSRYVFASAQYHGNGKYFGVFGQRVSTCKYGENAYQDAGLFNTNSCGSLSLGTFDVLSGNDLSYNNMCDLDRMLNTITHIAAGLALNCPHKKHYKIAIAVKHGNPCGASVGHDGAQVLRDMVSGDTRAIFGGLVITNFEIDEEYAEILMHHKSGKDSRRLDGIVAPYFSDKAFEILAKRAKCRLVINEVLDTSAVSELDENDRIRYVRGGILVQSAYDFIIKINESTKVNGSLSEDEKASLILAWGIGCTSNSNTITLVKNSKLIGNGVGQQDRVGCCELAIKRALDAGHKTEDSVAYSDSFFPFTDGPMTLIDAGIKAIFSSSGSIEDEKVIKCCKASEVALYMAPDKECRGFFGH